MKTLLAKVIEKLSTLAARAQGLSSGLPSAESFEPNSAQRVAIENAKTALNVIHGMPADVEKELAPLFDAAAKDIGETAIREGLEKGEIVLKKDHDAAVETAKDTARKAGEQAVRDEWEKEKKTAADVAARRQAAVKGELTTADVAAMPDSVFIGDNHEANLTAINGRLTELKTRKLDSSAKLRGEALALPVSTEGEASWKRMLDLVADAAAKGGAPAPGQQQAPAPKGHDHAAAGGESKKPEIPVGM